MKTYYAIGKTEFSQMNTQELRDNFLIDKLFSANKVNLFYSHYDRIL